MLVRTMRTALPLTALLALGAYGMLVVQRSGWGTGTTGIEAPTIRPEDLVMDKPHYEGFSPDGGRYTVSALTARQDFTQPNVVKLDDITAVTTDASDTRTELKARRGVFDNQTKLLDLLDGIDIASSSGMRAKLRTARVEIADGIVTTGDPVEVEMTAGRITANEMKLRHKARDVTFVGSVKTSLTPPQPAAAAAPKRQPESQPFGASDQPIDITSNRLDINDATKLAVFSGAVRAVQGGATLSSPHLHVIYTGTAAGLPSRQTADVAAPPEPGKAGKVERITASGPVEITQPTGERATGDSADFDAVSAKAYLAGNVVLTQVPDRRAEANRAEFDQRAETVLLVGDVKISQGQNELRGQRVHSDRRAARTQISSPKEDGGNGRIAARFVRNGEPATAASKAPAASPFGATFKTDPNAPVDVQADTLDIDDARKTALFAGNVMAVQDGFTLRTVEMTAYYSGEAGLGDMSRRGPDGQSKIASKGSADLQRIEARKSVVVQSADGQTATGDWANYDTRRNTVTLGGDVVLTRGQNAVRGSRLTIDMTSGQSIMETEPGASWSARAQPTGTAGAAASPVIEKPGAVRRPSAVFYPKQMTGSDGTPPPAAQSAKRKPAAASTGDAWGPITRPVSENGGN